MFGYNSPPCDKLVVCAHFKELKPLGPFVFMPFDGILKLDLGSWNFDKMSISLSNF